MSVKWTGDLSHGCDICKRPFGRFMYDARTVQGRWGNLDDSCFIMHGVGLGTGQGQKYERQADDSFVKVAGEGLCAPLNVFSPHGTHGLDKRFGIFSIHRDTLE